MHTGPAHRGNVLLSSTCCRCPGLAALHRPPPRRQLRSPSSGAHQLLSRVSGEGGRSGERAHPSCGPAACLSAALRRQTLGGTVPGGSATQHLLPLSTSRLQTGAAAPTRGRGPRGSAAEAAGAEAGAVKLQPAGWDFTAQPGTASSAAGLPWKGTVLSWAPSLQASRRDGSCLGSLPCWVSSCRDGHSQISVARCWSVISDRQDCSTLLCSGSGA